MEALQNWLNDLKKPRWYINLPQALLGTNFHYFVYRFRYFFLNNLLSTGLHLFEFYLLGVYFNNQQFFGLILLRAFTLIIKNAWWGALEGLREQVRRYTHLKQLHLISRDISCWFYNAIVLAIVIFSAGLFGLWHFFTENQHHSPDRFMLYGFAMLLQLSADLMTRVIHSGIFATQRIYRPWWSIPLPEVLGFVTIVILLPIARPWCLPLSYIVFSFSALYLTWHYACKAYRLHARAIFTRLSRQDIRAWWQSLPTARILWAAIASAAMSLEGIILWLLQPLIKTDPVLFKLIYLLSPQISAGFNWARLCYFDFKKLHSLKWELFTPRFFQSFWPFSALIGVIFWLLACISSKLFLPEISVVVLACFLPLFIGRSLLAFCQIRLYAAHHYSTIVVGTALLAAALLLGNHYSPFMTLLFIFIATSVAIGYSIRPHLKTKPIFPSIHLTPIYRHLDHIHTLKAPINLLYFEFAKNLHPERRQLLLEQMSALVGSGKLSMMAGANVLCTLVDPTPLNTIKTLALGVVACFHQTGWQADGQSALQKASFLKKNLFNFNETYLPLAFADVRNEFLQQFPEALIIPLNEDFYCHFKNQLADKEACSQLVRAFTEVWLSALANIRLEHYFALFYKDDTGDYVFMAKASRQSLPSVKQWQRRFWQLRIDYLCSTPTLASS